MEATASLIQRRVGASTICLDLAGHPRGSGQPEFAVRLTCHVTRYISAGRGRKLELRYSARASFVAAGVPADEDGVRGMMRSMRPLRELDLTDDEWESVLPEDVVPQLADLARGHRVDAGGAAEVDMAVDRHVRYSPARVLMSACKKIEGAAAEEDDDDETECSVCFDALVGGEEAVELPGCAHAFHRRCISRWFRKKPTCPLCRGRRDKASAPRTADAHRLLQQRQLMLLRFESQNISVLLHQLNICVNVSWKRKAKDLCALPVFHRLK